MPKTIHDDVNQKIELAKIYAQDGAFYEAARCLKQAADIYRERGEEITFGITRELT